ncbi:hypothetical protein DEO72_LG9g2042 [Vigna unguiculata]|uniref:Uncharacterized protein n=1 Tax=Vigna unguiculata TaxID=3917 RepID=A0A4D6N4T4_VIGUN|nr:hypothetical protein DEO72_LG9g2042 [Vigna unguiculata]
MPKPLGVRARPKTLLAPLQKKSGVQICHSFKKESEVGGNDERDWTTSFLLFLLWATLIYYVFFLTPNQTPISLVAGVAIIIYAGLAGQDVWKEFYQYFRESKFIHITSIDFIVLSTFAPFWVYNDMTARKW